MVLEEWKTLMCLAVLKHAMSYIIEIFKAGNEDLFHIGLHIQKPFILYNFFGVSDEIRQMKQEWQMFMHGV